MSEIYTTIQGDAWDLIAFRLWGEERYMHHLLMANPEHREVVLFEGGISLQVPEVEKPRVTLPLPPWKVKSAAGS